MKTTSKERAPSARASGDDDAVKTAVTTAGSAGHSIRAANLPLFERRPKLWMLALMVDRLEEPLRALRMQALEAQDLGDARALLSLAACTENAGEHYTILESTGWLLARIDEMKTCAENLTTSVNVGLQEALGPPGIEADPAGIERFCANVLQCLGRLLALERQILERRLHPDCQDRQFSFAGVSADAIGSYQEFVARMREFLENGVGNNFEFTIHLNFDRLAATSKAAVSAPPAPLPDATPENNSTAAGGCLIMVAVLMLGFMVPFPVGLVISLLLWGVWLLVKSK